MSGWARAGERAAPPVPTSCAIAVGSVLGSGGKVVETGGTGGRATPAAHGLGLINASPAERKALVVPQVGVTWPEISAPSAQIALVEPLLAAAVQLPPPPTQAWPSA